MLRTMEPVLHGGTYVFGVLPHGADLRLLDPVATMQEAEGLTVVLREEAAAGAGLTGAFRAAWITLSVRSDLQAVGLTAAFARALADANVGCNVIAGVHHDHIFVPVALAQRAMAALEALQSEALAGSPK
jgi:hypothetical protein